MIADDARLTPPRCKKHTAYDDTRLTPHRCKKHTASFTRSTGKFPSNVQFVYTQNARTLYDTVRYVCLIQLTELSEINLQVYSILYMYLPCCIMLWLIGYQQKLDVILTIQMLSLSKGQTLRKKPLCTRQPPC